ncbi:MAG: hypothetical protein UH239_02605 [Acutalibacteraceae bacterium]|nr:hypothetical protein [Acutalibacteraceae bacterium]
MWENIDIDRHYTGVFKILEEDISGELIYNKQNGVILLNLVKEVCSNSFFGKSYAALPFITGKLNTGTVVTLFNNRCSKNHTQAFNNQRLVFVSEYMIWSNSKRIDSVYNKMVCTLKNAFQWSSFSSFKETEMGIKVKDTEDKKTYNWFGANITFSSYINNPLSVPPIEEETKIVQRLVLEIETTEKHNVNDFVSIRNKVLSLISFAIKTM